MDMETPFVQRPLRGSRISNFYPIKSLPDLSSLDSAFQLQEYISSLTRLDVHDVETITTLPPGSHNKDAKEPERAAISEKGDQGAMEGLAASEGEKSGEERDMSIDEACWIYEQLRRLAQDLSHPLITNLQQECSRVTCPEMKAGEWLYLCVAHGTDGAMEQCCAIDYIIHTLDSATALLNSPRAFPSRLQIPTSSHRHLSSLARRLGRIFAHAYFHHREAFEQAEAESSLYARFLSLSFKFDLVPHEFLVIPGNMTSTGGSDENGESRGFGSRQMTFGTSYDPRRSVGGGGGRQYQLQRSFQDEFLSVHKMKRLPQQYQQFPHQPPSPPPPQQQQQQESQQIQRQPKSSPMGGVESPRKIGRNRTHTMVLSEAAQVADELARVTAAAAAANVIRAEKEEEEREKKEKETKAREEMESEQRQKGEGESKTGQEMEEPTSDEELKNVDESVIEKEATVEENVSDVERVGKSTGNVAIEGESAVEAFHVTPDSEPEELLTGKESEPEEGDAISAKVGEEPRMQEVDITTASISVEVSNMEEGERSFEADAEIEVKEAS